MAYQLILKGSVQGVGCRYYCAQVAKQLKLHGSATNLVDGSVRVIIEETELRKTEMYAEYLRVNKYGYSFWGRISAISIDVYKGSIEGDYFF